MVKEYLNDANSKPVRLSRAIIETIEDMNNAFEFDNVNDCVTRIMREIAHGLRKSRSRLKEKGSRWNISFDLSVENVVTIKFEQKVKE
jgi:hypothetical protein